MKFCPSCQTEYEEEVMRFCPQDGTPLIEKSLPCFSSDDINTEESFNVENNVEKTLVRHNRAEPTIVSTNHIVIPTEDSLHKAFSSTLATPLLKESQQTSVLSVVLLTAFGTTLLLAIGFFAGYMFSSYHRTTDPVTNSNTNTNVSVNTKTSNTKTNIATIDIENFSASANSNVSRVNLGTNVSKNPDTSSNTNVGLKPSPTPSPFEVTSSNANGNINAKGNVNVSPSSSPETKFSPSSTTTKIVEVGALNSRALNLVKPNYPQTAKQKGASGLVTVRALIDEEGNVLVAKAVSGHQMLRDAAESAAKQSKFTPVVVDGKPVKASGLIFYNFVIQQ